jgi:hypothetical protein
MSGLTPEAAKVLLDNEYARLLSLHGDIPFDEIAKRMTESQRDAFCILYNRAQQES